MVNVTFSVNSYDSDGDVYEEGVFLHFGDTRVKVADSVDEFEKVMHQLVEIHKQLIYQHG